MIDNEKSPNTDFTELVHIRNMHRSGFTVAAISKVVGLSQTTVRRRLKQPVSDDLLVLERMLESLENARDQLVNDFLNDTIVVGSFDNGEEYVVDVRTVDLGSSIDLTEKKASFSLQFEVKKRV